MFRRRQFAGNINAAPISRRQVLGALTSAGAAVALAAVGCTERSRAGPSAHAARALPLAEPRALSHGRRVLGNTGVELPVVSLGGEGILRTSAPNPAAVAMICAAIDAGVRYCDTAPAYEDSERHYGAAFRATSGAREKVFLASKTHERTRVSSLGLLERSLRILGTDHIDLWQLHDLRTNEDLDAIFGRGGAIETVEQAKREGKIRFVGITGHADPEVLLSAMRQYPFDTVLCPINPSDPSPSAMLRGEPQHLSFLETVVPEARRRGMGVIGMKVFAAGRLVQDRVASVEELIRYAAAFADTMIIGCRSAEEICSNLAVGARIAAMGGEERTALEARLAPEAARYSFYKRA
jgi:aryl-alcohol dehydrogenase-like predicted oxidoreductase